MQTGNLGLVFTISPAKRMPNERKYGKNDDEEHYMLILAPFNRAPKINFGTVKINECVEKVLTIVNPQEFGVQLSVKNAELEIDNMNIEIAREANIEFKIKWQPQKADQYKFVIHFEVSNSRLKFIVHAFGTCIETLKNAVKKPRKPLTILQPLRPAPATKTNTVNVELKKSATKKEPLKLNETRTLQKSIKENKSSLNKLNETKIIDKPHKLHLTASSCVPNRSLAQIKFDRHLYRDSSDDEFSEYGEVDETRIEFRSSRIMKASSPYHQNHQINVTTTINTESCVSIINQHCTFVQNESDDSAELVKWVLVCQRMWRMKVFRRHLNELKRRIVTVQALVRAFLARRDFERRKSALVVLQKWVRAMKMRFEYLYFKRMVVVVQKVWKAKFEKRRLAAIVIQKWVREKQQRFEFLRQRRAIVNVQRIWKEKYARKRQAVTKIQKWLREKRVRMQYLRQRRAVVNIQKIWKAKFERKVHAVVKIQRWVRDCKLRFEYLRQKRALISVQRIWKEKFERKKQAAIVIQRWVREKSERFGYLRQKRALINIQRIWKAKYVRKTQAAIVIQRWVRSQKTRFDYLNEKRAIIRVQRMWKAKYTRKNQAAIVIQRWCVDMKCRFEYLELKRATVCIQLRWKAIYRHRVAAATKIQQFWRMHRFRNAMTRFRNNAMAIQRWYRALQPRIHFLKLRKAAVVVQRKFRAMFYERSLAALKIQHAFRVYKLRKLESERMEFLNRTVTIIQACWRSFKCRKAIKASKPKLEEINRNLVSIANNPALLTLKERVEFAVSVLVRRNPLPTINQIMHSLNELACVTRVTPECCALIADNMLIDMFYDFIMRCNRSQPHVFLINLVLTILNNLIKCEMSARYVIANGRQLCVLINLLNRYQFAMSGTEKAIFLNVSMVLIVNWKLNREAFVSTIKANAFFVNECLTKIRTKFDMKSKNYYATVCQTQQHAFKFTIEPEWDLNSNKEYHHFANQLELFNYLMKNIFTF